MTSVSVRCSDFVRGEPRQIDAFVNGVAALWRLSGRDDVTWGSL